MSSAGGKKSSVILKKRYGWFPHQSERLYFDGLCHATVTSMTRSDIVFGIWLGRPNWAGLIICMN